MLRSRSWFGSLLGKPKNPHSLEHLKYLYNVLSKNQVVSESNRSLLVETLRSIAEILIWGDQNDSTVFDFFLEKNMLSFFLKIMKQKCGSYVCVQLLQTLNILFENIRNETSLYYLLSNNHVNCIIVHKFDFSDEEVMAYYISFLKTLSLKLNAHTVHFFYNEHTNDFPLYTEAIKFFNHPETMVRIAVRTLTLNVYAVDDTSMLDFIRDKTAAPYFSNLVWFIGKHVAELDTCLRFNSDHQRSGKLADLVAEHLDHLHYINDILSLEIKDLNQVLTDHLINKLFLPLYIESLSNTAAYERKNHIKKVVALFLLSQVFLIISHGPLVQLLAGYLLSSQSEHCAQFSSPDETCTNIPTGCDIPSGAETTSGQENLDCTDETEKSTDSTLEASQFSASPLNASISDEEKSKIIGLSRESEASTSSSEPTPQSIRHRRLSNRPCLYAVLNSLDITGDDYSALFGLCLLYAIGHNEGVGKEKLAGILSPADSSNDFNVAFLVKLVKITCHACAPDPYIRLVSLELSLKLVREMARIGEPGFALTDAHVAAIAGGREEITSVLRTYYKTEDMFLDLFEDEYNELSKKPLNVEFLMMDAAVLLPPTATPMTGIEFSKRLPCGEVERVRRAIRVFFLMRDLCIALQVERELVSLPLTPPQSRVQIDQVLDLNNSDLIACTVVTKDGAKIRRFLVIDGLQLILVEPDTQRLGWGVTKLVGFLQDLEVSGDKEDNRCLHITIQRPLSSNAPVRIPLLAAKFVFDDHIRCMAANQRLTKGRMKVRQKKMHQIAKLLDLPSTLQPCPSPLYSVRSRPSSSSRSRELRPLSGNPRITTTTARRDSAPEQPEETDHDRRSRRPASAARSRDASRKRNEGSPLRMPRPRSEEIPLEDIRNRQRKENILLSGVSQSRFNAAHIPPMLASTSSSVIVPVNLTKQSSEGVDGDETSFTEESHSVNTGSVQDAITDSPSSNIEEKKKRLKGQVETV